MTAQINCRRCGGKCRYDMPTSHASSNPAPLLVKILAAKVIFLDVEDESAPELFDRASVVVLRDGAKEESIEQVAQTKIAQ